MLKQHNFYPGDVPTKPGCYVYRDSFGDVIYVGKASNLRRRMSQYFQPSRETRADAKLRSLINSIETWEFFTVRNEDEALILESRLIKEYAPRYNVLMRDDKRMLLLKIDMNEKFPRLKMARLKKDDSCLYFGPFPHGSALRMTADFLIRHFKLRTCKTACPNVEDRAHCMAGAVRDCCRPCVGEVTEEEYMERVNALKSVLEGKISEVESDLEDLMKTASKKNQFEKAALYRDMAANIRSVYAVRNRSFLNAPSLVTRSGGEEAVEDLRKALKLSEPPDPVICFDISNISGTLAVASMVTFTNGRPDKAAYRRFRIKTVEGANDFAMMSEAVGRHFSRLIDEGSPMPGLLMVDGGKGQLSSALETLVKLKCKPFPVIGLAKKHEEVFIPGSSKPVIISRDRPALKLLQAVRDEAHRFAITYHRALRMDTIRNSILDDIEGIGETRKTAILKEFGSVRALRRATAKDIERRVKGIGSEFAEKIWKYLQKHSSDGEIDVL